MQSITKNTPNRCNKLPHQYLINEKGHFFICYSLHTIDGDLLRHCLVMLFKHFFTDGRIQAFLFEFKIKNKV